MFKAAVFLVALSVTEHWVCATPLTKSEEFDISGNDLIRNPGTALPTIYQILKKRRRSALRCLGFWNCRDVGCA